MYSEKMTPNDTTSFLVSRFMYVNHIYKALDARLKDVFWAHRLFNDIENNITWVFGVFDKTTDKLLGVCLGNMEGEYFNCHVIFERKTDAIQGASLCEKKLQEYCTENHIELKGVVGYPPINNRAALFFGQKMGYKKIGIAKKDFIDQTKQRTPCFLYRKDF
jgi:hypothetical protein